MKKYPTTTSRLMMPIQLPPVTRTSWHSRIERSFGFRHWSMAMRIPLIALLVGLSQVQGAERSNVGSSNSLGSKLGLWEGVPDAVKERSKWAVELGIGVIADSNAAEFHTGGYEEHEGPGEGMTYNATVSYQIHEFDWRTKNARFQPTVELTFMLTIVDQDTGGTVPDVNFGALFRWRDFPWNHYIYTTCGVGGGLSYSFDDWQADIDKHPGEDRSQLKFWLNFQWTFAAPSHPEHQLVLFFDHQSGANIFDDGGVDSLGIGYRHLF